MALFSPPVTAS